MFAQAALVTEMIPLNKFALRLTKNKNDAADLVQSTCLRALEKAHYFEEGTNLFSWTSKIMFNLFVSNYRRKAKFETQYDPENAIASMTINASQDIHAELEDVNRAMMKLSPGHREVLTLICIKELRYEEAAKALDVPVGTVRSRLSRAREELKMHMNTPRPNARPAISKLPVNKNIPAYIASHALRKVAHHS